MKHAAAVAACLALVACGPSPAFDEPEVVAIPKQTGVWTPAPDDLATPFGLGQLWVGTYNCAQGETQVALHIVAVDGADVSAIFQFVHIESGAKGLFKMHGRYRVTHREIDLAPGEWIERPEGYVTVGLRGRLTLDGRRMFGVIDGPGCSTFSARLAP